MFEKAVEDRILVTILDVVDQYVEIYLIDLYVLSGGGLFKSIFNNKNKEMKEFACKE